MNDSDLTSELHNSRTIVYKAASALDAAVEFWCELWDGPEVKNFLTSSDVELFNAKDFFLEKIFLEMGEDPDIDADFLANDIGSPVPEFEGNGQSLVLYQVMLTVVAYVVQAIREDFEGNQGLAWSHVSDALYWSGMLCGAWAIKMEKANPAREMANLRHKETHNMRKFVEDYWRKEKDPKLSAQKVATQMIQDRVINLSHKKIAEIISALRKREGLR